MNNKLSAYTLKHDVLAQPMTRAQFNDSTVKVVTLTDDLINKETIDQEGFCVLTYDGASTENPSDAVYVKSWVSKEDFENKYKRAIEDDSPPEPTKIEFIPVYLDVDGRKNTGYFVDATDLLPVHKECCGAEVLTSALKLGKTVSLFGISQIDSLVDSGEMNHFDQLDNAVQLRSLIIKDGDTVYETSVAQFKESNFIDYGHDELRTVSIDFVTDDALKIHVFGEIDLDTTYCTVYAKFQVTDSESVRNMKLLGYTLNARRIVTPIN